MRTLDIALAAPQADVTLLRAFLNQHEGVYRRVVEDEEHPFCPGHVRDEMLTSDEARRLFEHEALDTPILVVYHGGLAECAGGEEDLRMRPDLPRSLHQLVASRPWEPYRDWTPVFTSLPAMLWFEPVAQPDSPTSDNQPFRGGLRWE